ncbi:hypothetical protein [Actinoplanes sp. ATCC 53533]|uniref:hypothetical protein n=1 Tax=Actinoplanes sp. ATCC 53533 TaxID=1288362 RepID=UPI001F21E55A|nr:hypothetical protein [Actinoplanes sp. ATCC 53533]
MSKADSEVNAAQDAQDGAEQAPSRGVLLAAVGVVWMAAMLWSARATITGRADAEMEVTSTAYALPGAVSASLVAGAALGLAVLAFLTRGGRTPGVTVRFIIATGTGLAAGLLGALSIITINTEGWLYAVVGGTVAAAATIGGALAGFRVRRVTAAVCWGAVTVFVVGVVLTVLQDMLLPIFGSGETAASQTNAASWFALLQSVLSGLAGGVAAYQVLRRARRRATGPDLRWPLYALAGAGPGLLLVVGEGADPDGRLAGAGAGRQGQRAGADGSADVERVAAQQQPDRALRRRVHGDHRGGPHAGPGRGEPRARRPGIGRGAAGRPRRDRAGRARRGAADRAGPPGGVTPGQMSSSSSVTAYHSSS